jgi:hypothetical protein
VSVAVPCPPVVRVRLEGLIVTVMLDADDTPDNVTAPAKELILVKSIDVVPAVPCTADTDEGLADIPKSGVLLVAVTENVVQTIENGFTPYPSMPGSILTRVHGVLGMPHAASALAQNA